MKNTLATEPHPNIGPELPADDHQPGRSAGRHPESSEPSPDVDIYLEPYGGDNFDDEEHESDAETAIAVRDDHPAERKRLRLESRVSVDGSTEGRARSRSSGHHEHQSTNGSIYYSSPRRYRGRSRSTGRHTRHSHRWSSEHHYSDPNIKRVVKRREVDEDRRRSRSRSSSHHRQYQSTNDTSHSRQQRNHSRPAERHNGRWSCTRQVV